MESTQPVAQAALTAHMLPPLEAVMPPPPLVRRHPSVLNMSFFEELGQMAERSDDDTRRLLGKFAAEAEGSMMPPALKRLVSGEASGPPKMTRSNSAYLREMAQASSSSSNPPLPPSAIGVPPGLAPPMVSGRKSSELLEEGLNLFSGGHLPNFSFSGVRALALLRPPPLRPRPAPHALHPVPPEPRAHPCRSPLGMEAPLELRRSRFRQISGKISRAARWQGKSGLQTSCSTRPPSAAAVQAVRRRRVTHRGRRATEGLCRCRDDRRMQACLQSATVEERWPIRWPFRKISEVTRPEPDGDGSFMPWRGRHTTWASPKCVGQVGETLECSMILGPDSLDAV